LRQYEQSVNTNLRFCADFLRASLVVGGSSLAKLRENEDRRRGFR
jgi:hypothetical protein